MDARDQFLARMDASFEAERQRMEATMEAGDLDVEFGVTESGRTFTLGKLPGGEDDILDDMDFSITASNRSAIGSAIGNTERSMETVGTVGTIGTINTEGSIGTATSSIMDKVLSTRPTESKTKENTTAASESEDNSNAAAPQHSFQPLIPLPEHPHRQRSAPRAIPRPKQPPPQYQLASGVPPSQPSSAGSSGSAFLNNLLDPAASTFNNTQMSHTPPTHVSTSYEISHFGKRARSGSVSERLKVSSELEQKGMIDRDQKGLLKDLIISGQDNDLQHALDKYELGDPSLLENMLQSGVLANRAGTDIDLLGDLDLDFLNVNDTHFSDDGHAAHAYSSGSHPMQPPPHLPSREQGRHLPGEPSDGIGELDFDGGIGEGSDGFGPMVAPDRPPSPYQSYGQRSRSNSTFSIDYDYRQRSNSLFSALIGSVPEQAPPSDYGRWMEATSEAERPLRRASAPEIPTTMEEGHEQKDEAPGLTAATKRELKAEEKRRVKQEKKEQREREKREKKEKREQAKLEKQKKVEMEDKEEHQPGSGRPRSMSDPNIRTSLDDNGLLNVERPDGWIGAYSPESRKVRISKFLEKRNHRVWTKTVKYDVRKNFADSRLRVKGRFVKKEDELLMRELMSLT